MVDHGVLLWRRYQRREPRYKLAAAISLGKVGNTGLLILREEAASEDREVRQAAIEALLPHANPDDLTRLHEYVAVRTDDDPRVVELVRARAIELEELLAELQLAEAASADPLPEEEGGDLEP